jgi:hypothetical protein
VVVLAALLIPAVIVNPLISKTLQGPTEYLHKGKMSDEYITVALKIEAFSSWQRVFQCPTTNC